MPGQRFLLLCSITRHTATHLKATRTVAQAEPNSFVEGEKHGTISRLSSPLCARIAAALILHSECIGHILRWVSGNIFWATDGDRHEQSCIQQYLRLYSMLMFAQVSEEPQCDVMASVCLHMF